MEFKELTEKHIQLHRDIAKAINEKLVAFQMETNVTAAITAIDFLIAKYPSNSTEPVVVKVDQVYGSIIHPVAIKEAAIEKALMNGELMWVQRC